MPSAMRLPRAGLILAGVALLAATQARAAPVVLWNGAASGMSIDQVYALFPASQPATGQTLEDGAVEALSLPALIDGMPADALFFFRGRDLDAVVVRQEALDRSERSRNLAEAARLVQLASSQYGRPSRCAQRRNIAAVSCRWLAGGLDVGLSYHDFGGGSPALSILYRAAP